MGLFDGVLNGGGGLLSGWVPSDLSTWERSRSPWQWFNDTFPTVPMSQAPAGSVPNMGMGERANGQTPYFGDLNYSQFMPPPATPQPQSMPQAGIPPQPAVTGSVPPSPAVPPQPAPIFVPPLPQPRPDAGMPPAAPPAHPSPVLGTQTSVVPPVGNPPQAAPVLAPEPNFLQRLRAASTNMANAPGLIPGIFDAIHGGMTGQSANPAMLEMGTDTMTGMKKYAQFDPIANQLRPLGGEGGIGGIGAPGQNNGFLAPGVSYLDSSKSGDDYLKQFAPEVQAAVKSYIAGHVMPSGNPRMNAIASVAKTIAQKYGSDMGIPVSDEHYTQRRQYRQQLGSNSPNSAGGQAKAFGQGIEHMEDLARTLEKLDNSNGLGIPAVAKGINAVRQWTSTEQAAISDKAKAIGQVLSGEVGKLFSGSAGGGVEERRLTRERFDTITSPKQLAAALEATLEMMRGGLVALEQRRDEVLGPGSNVRFINPGTEKKIHQIEETIARLKGQGAKPAQAAPASTAGTANGIRWSVQ